jgi:ferredoxin-type protein NapF
MRRELSFRLLRLAVQSAFFAGFVILFLGLAGPAIMPFSRLPLAADPLVATAALLYSRGTWLPALLPAAALALATLALGRAFCGWACPVGFLNDVVGLARLGKNRMRFGYLQYGVLAAVLILSVFTLDILSIADPLVIFQRSAYVAWAGAGVPAVLLLILLAAVVVQRFWCRALCPLGGLLGVFSIASPFRLRAGDRCVSCGKCHRVCPMGAIGQDVTKGIKWDPTACTKCLECEKACPKGAISFAPSMPQAPRVSASRRSFISGAAALGTLAVSRVAASALSPEKSLIRPPGSLAEAEFNAACARCESCAKACPNQVIVPAGLDAGLDRAFTPRLDFDAGYCQRCGTCGQVCPTGAVISQPEDKIKIGTAGIDPGLCIAWKDRTRCLICDEVCPVRAIRGTGRLQPRVDGNTCVGCGLCQLNCPVEEKAIRVSAAGERRRS